MNQTYLSSWSIIDHWSFWSNSSWSCCRHHHLTDSAISGESPHPPDSGGNAADLLVSIAPPRNDGDGDDDGEEGDDDDQEEQEKKLILGSLLQHLEAKVMIFSRLIRTKLMSPVDKYYFLWWYLSRWRSIQTILPGPMSDHSRHWHGFRFAPSAHLRQLWSISI